MRATTKRSPLVAPALSTIVGFIVTLTGLIIGLLPLHDNSYLTHLATGRLIVDTGHIPRTDPYSFTAAGHSWVVQSWLPSTIYGLVDRLAGEAGLLLVSGLTVAAAAWMLWALSRPAASLVGRLGLVAVGLLVGTSAWGPRPLMIGLILLGVTLLAAEGRIKPHWLVPVFWIWVNSHGSFPLGLLALGLFALGRRLDREDATVELRALGFATAGTLLGAVNPLGPRLLVFPIELLSRQGVLKNIGEWQAPGFQSWDQRGFLVLVALAFVVVARRPSWRVVLPAAVFVPLAMLSLRNMAPASLVLVPALAPGVTWSAALTGGERRPIFRPLLLVLVAAMGIVIAGAVRGDAIAVKAYPVEAVRYADEHHLIGGENHLLAPDYVGNYLEFRYGTAARTFIDDRYDMFPDSVIEDSSVVLRGRDGWQEVLDRYGINVVIWKANEPLAQLLKESSDWYIAFEADDWVLALPR